MLFKRALILSAVAAVLSVGASRSSAVIAPNLTSITPTTGGFLWNYDTEAQAGSLVAANDYFTIYDFQGYPSGGALITPNLNWVGTAALLTPPPPNYTIPDSGAIYNITFTYTGLTTTGNLGTFSIFSTSDTHNPLPGIYAGQDHDNSGLPLQFAATTDTPLVPEPATLSLFALAGASLSLRRRHDA